MNFYLEDAKMELKPTKVSFTQLSGIAYNESVTAGLRILTEDDDIVEEYPELLSAILITGINLQHDGLPNSGRASNVLSSIVRYADINGYNLVLQAASSGRLTTSQLKAWYKRYGFYDCGDFMYRGYQDVL